MKKLLSSTIFVSFIIQPFCFLNGYGGGRMDEGLSYNKPSFNYRAHKSYPSKYLAQNYILNAKSYEDSTDKEAFKPICKQCNKTCNSMKEFYIHLCQEHNFCKQDAN